MTGLPSLPIAHQGDSLSGYVQRLSAIHCMETRTEAVDQLGLMRPRSGRSSDTMFLDLVAPSGDRLRALCEATSLQEDQVRCMVLERYDDSWFSLAPYRGIKSADEFRRTHRKYWRTLSWIRTQNSPFCVSCLQERPLAHQIIWRIALLPLCLEHQSVLHFGCGCGKATPSWLKGKAYPPGLENPICLCGATVGDVAGAAPSASARELDAGQQVADWLESYAQDRNPRSAELLDSTRQLTQALLVADKQGRHGLTLSHSRHPLPADVARQLPWAVALSKGEGVASCPPTIIDLMRRVTARQPEKRGPAIHAEAEVSYSCHSSVTANRRNWRSYTPAMSRPAGFLPQHMPALFPLSQFSGALSDVLWDGARAFETDHPSQWRTTLLGLRRMAAVTAAAGLWQVNLSHAVRLVGASTVVRQVIVGANSSLFELGRLNEYWVALRDATSAVTNGPWVDYQLRREFILGSGNEVLAELQAKGMCRADAGTWLVEEYACCERRGLERLRPHLHQSLDGRPDGLEGFASELDSRITVGAAA